MGQNDNSWQVHSESGFSCHRLTLAIGFHADKKADQSMGTNWGELKNWRTSGYRSLYASGGGYDAARGRYKVVASGFYFCYAQIRLDDASRNLKRLIMARNGETDINNGFQWRRFQCRWVLLCATGRVLHLFRYSEIRLC